MDLTLDQYAIVCNAMIDRMYCYEHGSMEYGIYRKIAGELLDEIKEHRFYNKIAAKFCLEQMGILPEEIEDG